MAEWSTVRYDPDYPEPLDPEIIPLCDALNAAGFITTSSCCGHGYDWPRVWFEHSSDDRIEAMARGILHAEQVEGRPHFTVFRKQIFLDGYEWGLEIHLVDVFANTPLGVSLEKAVQAMNWLAEKIKLSA